MHLEMQTYKELLMLKRPLVSKDYNTNPHSAVIDAKNTMVMGDNKVKVIAWYDNEWGYSNRVVEVANQLGELIK